MSSIEDNVWYFPNNIDLRSCPKNGMSSIKNLYNFVWQNYGVGQTALAKAFRPVNRGPGNVRQWYVWAQSDISSYPFRKNSTKYAVKRDPVKRFCSAVEMLNAEARRNHPFFKSPRDWNKVYTDIDHVLEVMENGHVFNTHLIQQTYYLGPKEVYDHVYDISDLTHMFRDIVKACNIKWNSGANFWTNVSANSGGKERVEELNAKGHKARKHFAEPTPMITDNLTIEQIDRIKNIYKVD